MSHHKTLVPKCYGLISTLFSFLSFQADVSPIKKRLDLDSSIGADQASKETELSAPEGSVGGVKRASTEDASTPTVSEEKPKKQFKRRNVALYSALSTDDA